MKTKKAFTLIELLVVIAIIGILTTIAVISLNNARAKARDAKRIADMKQVQTALELFFNDRGRYPTDEEFATGSIYSTSTNSTSTYMQIIPSASNPPDGGCTSGQNTFYYSQNESGNSYTISFCLGGTTGSLAPGLKCLTPGGVLSVDCGPGGGGPPAFTCSDTVSYGGYDYPTVEIDSQCWLAENLNIGTQLCDTGTVCALEPDDTFDYNDIEKYCYGNNLANCTTYGGLYSWAETVGLPNKCKSTDYTCNGTTCVSVTYPGDCDYPDPATTPRQGICPEDWHVPSNTEWATLNNYLVVEGQGGSGTDAGGKLKEAGTTHWSTENCGSSTCNSSGFTALGGGARYYYAGGIFDELGVSGLFWKSVPTIGAATVADKATIIDSDPGLHSGNDYRRVGLSIRCLMD